VTCQAMTRIGWEQTAWNGIRSRRTNPTLLLHTLHVTRAHSPSLPPPSPRGRGVLTHLGSPSRVAFVQSRDRMERQGKPGTSQACNTRDDKSSRRERAKRPGPDDQAQVHEQKSSCGAYTLPLRSALCSHVPSLGFFLAHAVLRHSHDTGSGFSRRAVLDPEPGPPNGSGRGRERERERTPTTDGHAGGRLAAQEKPAFLGVRGCTVSLTFLSGFAASFFFSPSCPSFWI
jgi:hypothetical protein